MDRSFEIYGCSLEVRKTYGLMKKGTLTYAYVQQRTGALRRGIEWKFTLPEWVKLWQDSGHLHERGNFNGNYVMCRFNDVGPYEKNNVRIDTKNENNRESGLRHPGAIGKIKKVLFKGKEYYIKELAAMHKMPATTLLERIRRYGLTVEQACEMPVYYQQKGIKPSAKTV